MAAPRLQDQDPEQLAQWQALAPGLTIEEAKDIRDDAVAFFTALIQAHEDGQAQE
jgi:hypothetical protein